MNGPPGEWRVTDGLRNDEYSMSNRCTRAVLLLTMAAVPARAQLVRGTVTERSSHLPVPGVLMTLVADAGGTVATALSTDRGEFAIRAAGAGRYHVEAKRIGVRRQSSAPFDLGASETRTVDVELDAVLYSLPEVLVLAVPLCANARKGGARDGVRVASLWDEVRTALTATQISLRDRLFRARVVRYIRELDPRTMRVLSETRSGAQGIVDQPFFSLPPDSLALYGFWRRMPDDVTAYYAPDAAVLLSDAFVRDHCFRPVTASRDRRGLTGLGFEPAVQREIGDVRGTLWLDEKTFELRYLEFNYTGQSDAGADSARIGGELRFARLPSGAWIVRRWFIRMPQFGRSLSPPVSLTSQQTPTVLVRPVAFQLREEGGDVSAEGLRTYERPSVLTGIVSDSARGPLAGAVVRLAGTPYHGAVAPDGTFRLDSLPAGTFDVVVEHPGYDRLGVVAAQTDISLREGEIRRLVFRAADSRALVERLCEGRLHVPERATLSVLVRDSATGMPLPALALALTWKESARNGDAAERREGQELEATTDTRGRSAFCELPANGTTLTVNLVRREDSHRVLIPLRSLTLSTPEIAAIEIRVPPSIRR